MWGQRARADLTDPKGTGRGGGQCPQCAFPEWQHVPGSDAWPPGGHRRRWGCAYLQGVGPVSRGLSLCALCSHPWCQPRPPSCPPLASTLRHSFFLSSFQVEKLEVFKNLHPCRRSSKRMC